MALDCNASRSRCISCNAINTVMIHKAMAYYFSMGKCTEYDMNTGDRFARQWTSAQPKIASYIRSVVRDHHEAEDILQRVATIAFRKFDTFTSSNGGSFAAWTCTIARYELMRWRRDKARSKIIFNDDTIARLADAQAMISDELDSRKDALQNCIEQLDNKARRFLELRYLSDLTPSKIADQVGSTPNTIRVTLFRIRQVLEQCIKRRLFKEAGHD